MADAASGSHAHFDDHEYTMSHMVASEDMYVDESDTKDFLLPAEAPSHDEERELKSEHQLVSPVNGAEHEPVSPLHSAEAMPDSPSKAIPQARVKSIMQISTGGNRTADDEGFHALTKAAELFIQTLATGAYGCSAGQHVDYHALARFVQGEEAMSYMHDILPPMVKFGDVQEQVEKWPNAQSTDSQ
ncbi:histone-fold protein CHRAC subunit [Aphelenchoides avenae]|nr:histone-fold protein CHRAC subunit [Aphelenchus avenae]